MGRLLCFSLLIAKLLQAAPGFTFEERRIQEPSEPGKQYDIDLHYPYLVDPEMPGTAWAFNSTVQAIVQKRLAQFRKDELPPPGSPHGSALDLRSTVTTWQTGLISVLFDWSCSVAGNAHGRQELASLVFDRQAEQPIELSALFLPGTDHVKVLSELAIADLLRQQDEHFKIDDSRREWIQRGAGPVAANFRVFTVTDAALVLHFETYRVGSYAEGDYHVEIPWKTLEPLLARRWRSGL